MNALMNEGDALLNLDDFFQEEMVEEDVQDPEEIVEVEPAEEMEVSGEDEDVLGVEGNDKVKDTHVEISPSVSRELTQSEWDQIVEEYFSYYAF